MRNKYERTDRQNKRGNALVRIFSLRRIMGRMKRSAQASNDFAQLCSLHLAMDALRDEMAQTSRILRDTEIAKGRTVLVD